MRKLSKTLLSLLLIAAMLASFVVLPAAAEEPAAEQPTEAVQAAETQSKDAVDGFDLSIVMLDAGRKYYSVDSIKQIIDNAAAAGFGYIMLGVGNDGMRFLLDDMSLAVNGTTYSSEKVAAAIKVGNKAYDASQTSYSYAPTTDELTQSEMDAVLAYAKEKGMGVIPMLNTPGHMDAILDAAEALTGKTCSYNGSARTIDVTNSTAVAFTQAFVQKYVDYFASKGCKYFNMGADEYANDMFTGGSMGFGNLQSTGKYSYYVEYVNAVAGLIKAAKMTPMAFNDGIYFNNNTSSGTFDTDIVICYWSNGWDGYTPMPASDLASKGFKMVNTHGDYYWVLGKSNWQCNATKDSGFNYKTFQGGTIDNPSGAMFCIWADYPGAETEASVISKTADTIAAFGATLPKIDDNKTVSDEATGVSVTAPGLTGITVAAVDKGTELDGKKVAGAWNIELTTANGSYTGSAAVKVPLDGKWTGCTITAGVVNEETGKVDYGKDYDIKDGFLTFTAPHFSTVVVLAEPQQKSLVVPTTGTKTVEENGDLTAAEVSYSAEGIVRLESRTFADNVTTMTFKGLANGDVSVTVGNLVYQITVTNESYSSKKTITVAVGGTVTDTVDGEVSSTYTDDFVSVKTETKDKDQTYIPAELAIGTLYVSTKKNDTAPTLLLTFEDAVNGQYYIKNGNGQYISPLATTSFYGIYWDYNLSTTKNPVNISKNTDGGIIVSRDFSAQYGNTTAYLSISSSGSFVSTETNTKLYLYDVEPANKQTTISFTGKKAGTTQVKIGDVLYIITVNPENLDNVSPLKIEYWITNRYVSEGTTYNSAKISKSLSAAEAYKPEGVALDEIVPSTGAIEGESAPAVYWKTRKLPSTDKQTHDSGVDKTTVTAGTDISRVRYWGKAWQYTSDGNTWEAFESTDQIVAYYLQKTTVTDEIETQVVDWGVVPHTGYTSTNFVLVDYAVKYQSGERTPDTFPQNGKTQAFHCDPKDTTTVHQFSSSAGTNWYNYYRDIGMIRATNTADYEVYMITLTPSHDSHGSSYSVASSASSATKYTYAGTEKVVWVDDEANLGKFEDTSLHAEGYHVGGEATVPGLKIANRQAMLVTYYIRAVETEDSLIVRYVDETSSPEVEFYNYPITVNASTVFNAGINLPEHWVTDKITSLTNGEVENNLGKKQYVSSDLSTMPEIGAAYQFGNYECTRVVRSEDGKTVTLYYKFNNNHYFVADFGLPLHIDPSDIGIQGEGWTNASASGAKYGTTQVSVGSGLTYTPTSVMKERERITVKLSKVNSAGKTEGVDHVIYIIPASTVYYEEGFATYDGTWTGTTNKGTGTQTLTKLGENDKNTNGYGYDGAYAENKTDSNATAAVTTTVGSSATFQFKGTGLELYLRTENTNDTTDPTSDAANSVDGHSYMLVQVYQGTSAATENLKRMSFVDVNNLFVQKGTQYGYNTPCWTVDGMTDGEYTVVVRYVKGVKLAIDGFRVTNKAYESSYAEDNEAQMKTSEIRNMVLKQADVDNTLFTKTDPMYRVGENEVLDAVFDKEDASRIISGAVVIRRNYTDESNAGALVDVTEELVNIGPKNEIYLNPGEAVVMQLTGSYDSVQVGMRSLTGEAVSYKINGTSATMNSTVDMYYKVVPVEGKLVIQNVSGGILALTKLKVTGAGTTTNDVSVETTPEAIRYAMALMRGIDVPQFTDVAEDAWYHDYVYDLVYRGVVNGMTATTYEPEGKLTRAQFVKLLACSLADAETLKTYEGKHPFKDSEGHWAEAYIAWAKDKGIVEGVSATEFDPEAPITREQMATIFGRYALKQGIELPKSDNAAGSFPDADKISEYAREFVELMRIAGILNGYEDGTFRPQGNATRAEAAKLFSLFLSITDKLAK